MLPFLWCLVPLLYLLAVGPAPRPGNFSVVGPGGGGAMFHPTISPHDPDTVLVNCDMTGAYITHDGGKLWRMFNLRGVVRFFVFDPLEKNVIYAQATGLWRSDDSGASWSLVYPNPATLKGIKMSSDHADESLVAEPDPLGDISAMVIDPADSKVFYVVAGKRREDKSALFVSHDAGVSWTKQADLPGATNRLWLDPHSPKDARVFVIAGPHLLAKQSSSSTTPISGPAVKSFTDVSAGFAKDGKPVIYVVGDGSAFVLRGTEGDWNKVNLGSGAKARAIATSVAHPDVAYVSYNNLEDSGVKWLGVATTTDGGRTWNPLWKEDSRPTGKPAENIHDAWITARFGADWPENPLMLGVADQDPNLAYGTDLGRTMRTSDGGKTWFAVYSRKSGENGWTSTGLDVTNAYGYHFDPFDHHRQFMTLTDIGLFRSEDGGQSWVSSTTGVPKDWVNTTYWIEFDPEVKGRMWSVNSWTHDLPRPKMWRRNGIRGYRGGVCRSDDGGRTWLKSNQGMGDTAPTHIVLDPTSPRDARILYVAAFGRGVYKSLDGGKSWTLKNNGITQQEPFAWRIVRDSAGTLYLLIARRSEDGSIGNESDGALYKSADGAEHWAPIHLPEGTNAPNGLAVDTNDDKRIYLAMWARDTGMHGEGGGVYLSEDGAQSWRRVLERDRHVYDITIDPKDPHVIYAGGFESSAWKSSDRGENWTRIPGFNFKWGYRVMPDLESPAKVYITTFGGGVWHGSLDGEDRPLDIVTPELLPGR